MPLIILFLVGLQNDNITVNPRENKRKKESNTFLFYSVPDFHKISGPPAGKKARRANMKGEAPDKLAQPRLGQELRY